MLFRDVDISWFLCRPVAYLTFLEGTCLATVTKHEGLDSLQKPSIRYQGDRLPLTQKHKTQGEGWTWLRNSLLHMVMEMAMPCSRR